MVEPSIVVSPPAPTFPSQTVALNPKSKLRVRTSDDLTLCVHRIAPQGPCRGAVVLCHGLAANSFAFDLPGRSLAGHLSAHGFECFIPDLRGTGDSGRPATAHGLDDYVERDLPAIIGLVREQALSERIHWLGHSMGGILFFLYASEQPSVPVQRAIALGTALDYRVGRSVYQPLSLAQPFVPAGLRLPYDLLSRISASTSLRRLHLMPESMNFQIDNVEPEVRQAILKHGFGPVPMRLLDDLSTALKPGGLARRGGRLRLRDTLPSYRTPTLLVGGVADVQCGVEAIDETARLLGHVPELRVAVFGRAYGQRQDYGHFDLMVGRNAPTEVWPHLTQWLLETPEA